MVPGVKIPVAELNWILGAIYSADACLIEQLIELANRGEDHGEWFEELTQYADEIRQASQLLEARLRDFLIGQAPVVPEAEASQS